MINIIIAGGWTSIPLVIFSIMAITIIMERLWYMRTNRIIEKNWLASVWFSLKKNALNNDQINKMRDHGVIGRILFTSLQNKHDSSAMDDLFVLEAGQLKQSLHRFLNMLGTIAALSPLLGLLGTVLGMIEVFADLVTNNSDPTELSGGISQALISTAIGLIVSIPATFFYRSFMRKSDAILAELEYQYLLIRDLIKEV